VTDVLLAALSVVRMTCMQNGSANVQYLKPGTVASGTVASCSDSPGYWAESRYSYSPLFGNPTSLRWAYLELPQSAKRLAVLARCPSK
jgi:hypothetical protein